MFLEGEIPSQKVVGSLGNSLFLFKFVCFLKVNSLSEKKNRCLRCLKVCQRFLRVVCLTFFKTKSLSFQFLCC